MTALGLAGDRRRISAPFSIYTVEYMSSEEHRGIIMHSEVHEATNVAAALAYAKARFSDIAAEYGARGYRVRDANGVLTTATEAGFILDE